jgi:hypothetical protein
VPEATINESCETTVECEDLDDRSAEDGSQQKNQASFLEEKDDLMVTPLTRNPELLDHNYALDPMLQHSPGVIR